MKKFLFTALLGASVLAMSAGGAWAEGASALQSETQTNSDTGSTVSPDNSYAQGTIKADGDSVTATSSTGTQSGTGTVTVTEDGKVDAATGVSAEVKQRNDNNMERDGTDRANITADMESKTGVMKTRAKGAMGMLNPSEIKIVQQNLQQAGYGVEADGVWGNQTKAALKEYQKAKNLNISGKMDADTRASMGLDKDATPDSNNY